MLDLASHIVKIKEGHFDPDKFDDRYEDALKELLKMKQEGKPIERPEPTNVVNLMDALRRSVEASGGAPASSRGRDRQVGVARLKARAAKAQKDEGKLARFRKSALDHAEYSPSP